jgi:cytochrome b
MSDAGKKSYGRVWDPLVRLFHWTLAGAFATAWFERSEASIHQTAGKIVLVLIILRTAWGLIGPASARFDTFVKGPVTTIKYVFSIFRGKPAHYLGHNPAGAAMIGALLLSLVTTTVSGVLMTTSAFWGGEWIEWIHGMAATLTAFLIAGHLLGVIAACFQHRENLPLAMVTGRKLISVNTERFLGPTMFTRRRSLAALTIVGAAFSAWAGSNTLLNAGVWRMHKIIAAEAEKGGCEVVDVTGPRVVVYPVLQLQYDVGLTNSDTSPVASIPALGALDRKPRIDIANVAAHCQQIAGSQLVQSLGAPLVSLAALAADVHSKLPSFSALPSVPDDGVETAAMRALSEKEAALAVPKLLDSSATDGQANAAASPLTAEPRRQPTIKEAVIKRETVKPKPAAQNAAPKKTTLLKAKRTQAEKAKPRKKPAKKKLARKAVRDPYPRGSEAAASSRASRQGYTENDSSRGSGSDNSGSGSRNSGSGSNNSGSGSGGGNSGGGNSGSGGGDD